MRKKTLQFIFTTVLVAIYLWVFSSNLIVEAVEVPTQSGAVEELRDDEFIGKFIDGPGFTIYYAPGARAECKNALAELLRNTPPSLLPTDFTIELYSEPKEGFHGAAVADRARGGVEGTMRLNCNLMEGRFREVYYHELGHLIYMALPENAKVPFEKRDPVYARNGAPNYITEYATTNANEDFADSFMMYMTRRGVFGKKAMRSEVLRVKYESMEAS